MWFDNAVALYLGRNVRKRTFCNERQTKTQISLSIRAVWPESSLSVWKKKQLCILGYLKCAQWRFWSACANAQADLNLRWAHISEDAFSEVPAHSDKKLETVNIINVFSFQTPFSACLLAKIGDIWNKNADQYLPFWSIKTHTYASVQSCMSDRGPRV